MSARSDCEPPDATAELDAFDYELPPERIAQRPLPERDAARLLVLERTTGCIEHSVVRELPRWLDPGDLLVVNATRVVPARLRGRKTTGGRVEVLLLERVAGGPESHAPAERPRYRALLRARGARPGLKLELGPPGRGVEAEVVEREADGRVVIALAPESAAASGADFPYDRGEAPLPPYIRREKPDPVDLERYQTVYARVPGSVAAPTAGLHLTQALLDALAAHGVERTEVVLHVGLGTFQAPGPSELASGRLHPERFELPEPAADAVAAARARGRRVVAVGTTTARVLETQADGAGARPVRAGRGVTDLFVRPGHRFRAADALLTNFHLPRSSLLLLVAAFAGRERVLAAYREAIRAGYRFYSYGDAMLIL